MAAIDTIPAKQGEVVRCLITAGQGGTAARWYSRRGSESIGAVSADSDLAVTDDITVDRIWYADNGVDANAGDVALRLNTTGGNLVQWLTGLTTVDRIDPTPSNYYGFAPDSPGATLHIFVAIDDSDTVHRIPLAHVSPSAGSAWVNLNIEDAATRTAFGGVTAGANPSTINLVIARNADVPRVTLTGQPLTASATITPAALPYVFGSMAAFVAAFDGVQQGSTNGLWLFGSDGSTASGGTGPGGNNEDAFVHTETSSATDAATLQTNGTCTMKPTMIPTGTDRTLRLRACIQGQFGDGREGLEVQHRASDSDAWAEAGFIHGWAFSDTYETGDTFTDEDGDELTCVADGGWVDFNIAIPDGARQIRLRPHYILAAQSFRHDVALREMFWSGSMAATGLSGQPLTAEATISAGEVSQRQTLTGQPLTALAAVSAGELQQHQTLSGQPLTAAATISAGGLALDITLSGQPLTAAATISAGRVRTGRLIDGAPLTAEATISPGSLVLGITLTGQPLTARATISAGRLGGLTPPVQPRHVRVSDIDHFSAFVVWDLAETPDPPLTGFEYQIGNGPWIATGSTATLLRLTGLDPGTAYAIRVRGRNRVGAGPASEVENFRTLPAEVATVTRFVTAEPTGGRSVDLGWQDPAFDGGEPLTGFEICVVPPHGPTEPWENVGLVRAHRVRGLALGHEYGFRVRAVNDVGAGAQSPLVYATPAETATVVIPPGFRLPLVDTDRQSLIVRLDAVDCRVEVWWQPVERAWFASLEAPVGSPVMSGRRLTVNAGLLAGRPGVLAGDVVCRAVDEADQERDPDRFAWGIDSHGLFWEPAAA